MELQNSSLGFRANEYHVKVLVIGDPIIGKSDFITKFIDYDTPFETLSGYSKSTQISYSTKNLKNLNFRPNDSFKFHIWEISDYDENRDLIRTYIENTQIILLCFSLKNPDSLDSLSYWLYEKKSNVRYILIGLRSNSLNKVNSNDIKNLCKSHNIEYFEFTDFNYLRPTNIIKPFIRYLDDIYPKVEIIVERQNSNMFNNIKNYCTIL
jgi:GTPase SAR1 family protein